MKLYGFPPSPNTWQVRALAGYLGVPLEFEFVDLTKGGAQTPAFIAINPTARTPALVDGDFKLWETMAIMQYVAGKKPNAAWPNDARTRADITRWRIGIATFGLRCCSSGWSRNFSISGRPTRPLSPKASRLTKKRQRCSTRI
jgi:glutathione S-transferase